MYLYIVMRHDNLADKVIKVFDSQAQAQAYSDQLNESAIRDNHEFYIVERFELTQAGPTTKRTP